MDKIPCYDCEYKHKCWKERYYCKALDKFLDIPEFDINNQSTINIIDNVVNEIEELKKYCEPGYFDYEVIRDPCINYIIVKEQQRCRCIYNDRKECEKYTNFIYNNKLCYKDFGFYNKEE